MANLIRSIVIGIGVLAFSATSFAGDAVDLSDKKGIPKDLKQYDPPERSLKIKPPPPPKKQAKKKDSTKSSSPTDQGNDPGAGGATIPKQIPKYIPPRQITRPVR